MIGGGQRKRRGKDKGRIIIGKNKVENVRSISKTVRNPNIELHQLLYVIENSKVEG